MDYLFGLGNLLSFILLYKYLAVFVLIFLGGIGVPMPSNTILFAAGAFASQDYLSFLLLLLVAVVANVLGDLVDYVIARKFGRKLIAKNYHKKFYFIVRRAENRIKPLEDFLRKHEAGAIFLSRFVSPINTVANFMAGLAPVPVTTFLVADIAGNFVSIAAVLVLGFFISESWQRIASLTGLAGGVFSIIMGVAIVAVAFYLIRTRKKK